MSRLIPLASATPWIFDTNRDPPVYTRLVPTFSYHSLADARLFMPDLWLALNF